MQDGRLVQAGDRLRAMGSEIAALEAKKRFAVEQEDYDTAKALKGQIERMRAAGRQVPHIFNGLHTAILGEGSDEASSEWTSGRIAQSLPQLHITQFLSFRNHLLVTFKRFSPANVCQSLS